MKIKNFIINLFLFNLFFFNYCESSEFSKNLLKIDDFKYQDKLDLIRDRLRFKL